MNLINKKGEKMFFSMSVLRFSFLFLFLSVPGICLSSSCKDLFVSGGTGQKYFYYITHKNNLESILKIGIG